MVSKKTAINQEVLERIQFKYPKLELPAYPSTPKLGYTISLIIVDGLDELANEQINKIPIWCIPAKFALQDGECVVATNNPYIEQYVKYCGGNYIYLNELSVEEAVRQTIIHYPDANYIRLLSPLQPFREPAFFKRYKNGYTGHPKTPDMGTCVIDVHEFLAGNGVTAVRGDHVIPHGLFAKQIKSVVDVTELENKAALNNTAPYKLYCGRQILILEREQNSYDFCKDYDLIISMFPHVASATILFDTKEESIKAGANCWFMFASSHAIYEELKELGVIRPYVEGPFIPTRLGTALQIVTHAFPGGVISVAGEPMARLRNPEATPEDIEKEIKLIKNLNLSWVKP